MTRRAFLEKYFLRFAATLAMLGLIVYTIYHVFGSSSGSLMTTPARRITDLQIMSGEAYLFRDEEVLSTALPGVVDDLAVSGAKVSKNAPLLRVWQSYSPSEIPQVQAALAALERRIAVLEKSIVSSDTTLSAAESYRKQAAEEYRAIVAAATAGDWSALSEQEASMLALLNRYGALTSENVDAGALLTAAQKEKEQLLRGSSQTLYNTRSSGYFYDRTQIDGYEALFTSAALAELTPESFAALTATEPQADMGFAAGKMVYGNEWSLAISFPRSAAEIFSEGERYLFSFPENRDKELNLTCTRLLPGEDRLVAVFSSDEVPADFDYLRVQSVEITVGSCVGYYVPDAALYIGADGSEGVYIFEESTVYFRRIEVIYRGDGYCIASESPSGEGKYLALNDMMVTSGGNLYDGRVYQ